MDETVDNPARAAAPAQGPNATATDLSKDDSFLDLGRALREFHATDREEFRRCIEAMGLGGRKAFYLIAIDRAFSELPVPKARLADIGWTKLHVLAPIVDHENYEDLLSKAEACSVRDLEAVVRGKMSTAPDGIRSIQFRLRRDHYEALTAALVENGATVGRRGLEGKEDALMRLVRQDRATSRKRGKAPV